MKRTFACAFMVGAGIVLLTCRGVQAIPPPWTLEEAKAGADLVLIAKMGKVQPVEGVGGLNRTIGLVPAEVLKGDVGKQEGEKGQRPKLSFLFTEPEKPKGPIARVAIGGTGHPEPKTGETALVFLKKRGEDNSYTVVCGKFGYVSMGTGTDEELAAFTKRIGMYRGWCERIGDEKLRNAILGYYQKALDFAAKQAEKPPRTH